MNLTDVFNHATVIRDNVQKVIIGKDHTITLLLTALIAGGHVLLEDVPGTGKTVLAKSMARSIQGKFQRIQFTPDLLPSDITGLTIYNSKEGEFKFMPGPAFCNILLADEINRATPRTQSALLECMEESQITVDKITYPLDPPFFVIATQNPIETAGTFPLPEAQLDRFLMQLSMGTPTKEEELAIMDRFIIDEPLATLSSVCDTTTILSMREFCKTIYVHNSIKDYMVSIIQATRNHPKIASGVSPRGTLAFLRCAQVYAALSNRNYVIPDDIKALAYPVLAHRIMVFDDTLKESDHPIYQILEEIPVPSEDFPS